MIYVAGPFFNPKERMYLNEMIEWIKREYPNEELFIPMEHFIPNGANLPNNEWAKKVYDMDVEALDKCDKVCALYLGHYSDTGTAWEIGYATAMKKLILLYVPRAYSNMDMSIMPVSSAHVVFDEIGRVSKSIYNQK